MAGFSSATGVDDTMFDVAPGGTGVEAIVPAGTPEAAGACAALVLAAGVVAGTGAGALAIGIALFGIIVMFTGLSYFEASA